MNSGIDTCSVHLKQLDTILSSMLSTRQTLQSKINRNQGKPEADHWQVQTISISNKDFRYSLPHGASFETLLQPRDRVLEHQFDFTVNIDLEEMRRKNIKFVQTAVFQQLLKHIHHFLVEAISNVISVSFKFLSEGKLEDKEANEYASKNMMLNIHQIYRQTIRALSLNPCLKDIIHSESEEIKKALTTDIDSMVQNILENLAENYPQAPVVGGSLRMKEVIQNVDRSADDENDFIFRNGLKISEHLKLGKDENGYQKILFEEGEADYTEFIMKLINSVIEVTQNSTEDSRERTVKNIFVEFTQRLFWLSGQKHYQLIANNEREKHIDKNAGLKRELRKEKQYLKSSVSSFFDLTLERDAAQFGKIEERLLNLTPGQDFKKSVVKPQGSDLGQYFQQLIEQAQKEGFQSLKKSKKCAYGQKVPVFVKPFTKNQIATKIFAAKHSSILRILTKWTKSLQDIFINCEEHVLQKLSPFKNIHNQPVSIWDQENKLMLVRRLKEQYKQVKKKFTVLTQNSYAFIGDFLNNEDDAISSILRYSETRELSSKINLMLTTMTLNYTSVLIHHLLKAGRNIQTQLCWWDNLNLVSFKVSDLLRSKWQCDERSFISLLKTLYLLDSSKEMQGKFKLVRIKNKLQESANNVIINYLFLGKLQCELQLSIQEISGKQKHYYTFSHFVYELTRGKFGSIAECAIMVSQLDPMINSCKDAYYTEKKNFKFSHRRTNHQTQRTSIEWDEAEQSLMKKLKKSMFKCASCSKLATYQIIKTFDPQQVLICNRCLLKAEDPVAHLSPPLREAIKEGLELKQIRKVKGFGQLLNLQAEQLVVYLSEIGELSLNMVVFMKEESSTFLVKLSESILFNIDSPAFDFCSLDYVDLTKECKNRAKQGQQHSQLCFSIDSFDNFPRKLFRYMGVGEETVLDKFSIAVSLFKDFKIEKNMIKSIKFKAEIISIDSSVKKWTILDRIVNTLIVSDCPLEEEPLKYSRQKYLQMDNLKKIEVNGAELVNIPSWLKPCPNIKQVFLAKNRIKDVVKEQLPPCIESLSLEENLLEKIDLSSVDTLKRVILWKNQLTDVNVANTNLEYLDVSTNRLHHLDLSATPSLRELYASENSLDSIDLQNNQELSWLDLSSNNFSRINVSHLRKLTGLYLTNNQLRSIDLSGLEKLQELYLQKNQLSYVSLSQLYRPWKVPKISGSNFHPSLLAVSLIHKTNLTVLSIQSNRIEKVDYLPISLTTLSADKRVVAAFNFAGMNLLQQVTIYDGLMERGEAMNLKPEVIFAMGQEEE